MRHLSARITSSTGRPAGERGPVVVQWVQAQTLFSPELPTWPPPLLQSRRGNGHPGANLTDSDYGLLRCRPAHSGSLHPHGEPDDSISEYTGVALSVVQQAPVPHQRSPLGRGDDLAPWSDAVLPRHGFSLRSSGFPGTEADEAGLPRQLLVVLWVVVL